ncbi:MAG: glycine--tRNA ligase subunit beta [Zetaproteobacteria bacterium CG06_land_8_20_14_3_00_59_53]|nr:MAG: glycine--tRNA ligase subunit beta [Zetaproteobacteria bacterium CG2_30_59_37]PIO90791.1 MAG: glycine--tRNA ligase subunit beta [Zetaproteobacteria bacterium CG23_combo_of_CG06-09_8_20_14_all_59_86]PIQ64918.1 MAG: glycine--tRNA ligase subunit beta [Zetaproteobacteria bacterium CG11_big_fil_rev_8_21_14_0_20_59_439]PIU70566.1 MAG: glycine--tRNA ligase subunit beta [Zetaproteobacteria bacterium CG06_land_8_20_14_3_00_59_53]PIU95944.1 MAG: glycine--tRNA ligase subunit beta [Zetaproteobacteri
MSTQPLLIEIGTEEIPAGVSTSLLGSLRDELSKLLAAHGIEHATWTEGCTPCRLLLHWSDCPVRQADRDETVWGPPEKVAYRDGAPTPAAEGFAKKSGLSLSDFTLADKGDGKGNYLMAVVHREGRPVADIIAEALPAILRRLPSPKQMKWNDGDARDDAFIRPVRWIVARLGNEVIPFSFAGVPSGTISRGHRISGGTGEISASDPLGWLRDAKVEADRDARMQRINAGMQQLAGANHLSIVADKDLVAEVADLTEWPVPVLCEFAADYLRLPEEVIRITLKNHQRCFITHDADGRTSNRFFAVANIDSKDPSKVAEGNARVVNARLADAAFYFDRDPQESLEARVEKLNHIVFQEGLGTVGDQVMRLRSFMLDNAAAMGAQADVAQRAAYLCKSDLTTGLVREFPELQGTMGGTYALSGGETKDVAHAIALHYQGLPKDMDTAYGTRAVAAARGIAIAEAMDKLLGYFHLGRIPTASADPYALRRAAISLIHLLGSDATHIGLQPVEMSLGELIKQSSKQWNQQRITTSISADIQKQVRDFIVERLLGLSASLNCSRTAIEAAMESSTARPLYQLLEVARLLSDFSQSETGQAVAAANKRIANILKKSDAVQAGVNPDLFGEEAERKLFDALKAAEAAMPEQAGGMLTTLAGLREPVDRFFDDVMVMAEDDAVRVNRLALLTRLRALFLKLADISRL